jgi:hypothetical protein
MSSTCVDASAPQSDKLRSDALLRVHRRRNAACANPCDVLKVSDDSDFLGANPAPGTLLKRVSGGGLAGVRRRPGRPSSLKSTPQRMTPPYTGDDCLVIPTPCAATGAAMALVGAFQPHPAHATSCNAPAVVRGAARSSAAQHGGGRRVHLVAHRGICGRRMCAVCCERCMHTVSCRINVPCENAGYLAHSTFGNFCRIVLRARAAEKRSG